MSGPITNEDIFKLLRNIQEENLQLKQTLLEEIKSLKDESSNKVQVLENKYIDLKADNEYLKKKLIVIERRLKKYNLVFYGIRENDNKTLISDVLKIINEKLNIKCASQDLRDIYRIGKNLNDKPRPVIIEVVNYKLKIYVLINSKKLKGTSIYIYQMITYQKTI